MTTAGFTYRVDGWFWEKTWLMYLIILVSGLLASDRRGRRCGCEKCEGSFGIFCIWTVTLSVCFVSPTRVRGMCPMMYTGIRSKPARWPDGSGGIFEQLYVEALLACGQVGTADLYMRNGWTSKRNTLVYRQLSLNIQAHYAYQEQDAAALPQHSGPRAVGC